MSEHQAPIFRKKALEKISSPDHLTEYLHVTSLGMWIVLAAALVLLAGMLAWSAVGTLETKEPAVVHVQDQQAEISVNGAYVLEKGMKVTVGDDEFLITDVAADELGRVVGYADVELEDGSYDGVVVVDSTKPIDFLLERG